MNRNLAIAALGGAVLLLVGALLWSAGSGPIEAPPTPTPEPVLQATEARTEAPPEPVAPEGRPIPEGVIELTPEERARHAAMVRERIKELTAEQRAELRGKLPEQQDTTGTPIGEAGPTPAPE